MPSVAIELVEEELRQLLDVRAALAQRRQPDREDVQAVIEVLAQLAVRDRLLRLAVGGRDRRARRSRSC